MAKPTPQACHALTTYFVTKYKERYGAEPVVNRHSARWGFDSLLQGMSPEDARALLDFYLTTASSNKHKLDWFFYNYDKIMESLSDVDKDKTSRKKLMEESERRAREWRERGNEGITTT